MSSTILTFDHVNKIYPNGVHALQNINFSVQAGEFLAVIGLSGSGKSTLLRCVNRLHKVSSGQIFFQGKEITGLEGKHLRQFRSQIGMVFQQFNLIPRRSVLTNVLSGSLSRTKILSSLFGLFTKNEIEKALSHIERFGLKGKENTRIEQLSGGQQQRVALARALMQGPSLLLADEPVASLDPTTSLTILNYISKINQEMGVTVLCNLHSMPLVHQYASRVIALKGGIMIYDGPPEKIDDAFLKNIYGEEESFSLRKKP